MVTKYNCQKCSNEEIKTYTNLCKTCELEFIKEYYKEQTKFRNDTFKSIKKDSY